MANTYVAIATTTVGSGGAANIEFTSIPQTYTDLVIVTSLRSTRTADWNSSAKLEFNGNTSSYTWRNILNNSGTVSSNNSTTVYYWVPSATATSSTFSNDTIYIPNYTSSNNKSFSIDNVIENNSTNILQSMLAGLWSNSAAITSIKITENNSQNFAQYSTATLYGIKNS